MWWTGRPIVWYCRTLFTLDQSHTVTVGTIITQPNPNNRVHPKLFSCYRVPGQLLAAYGGCFLVKRCAELAFSRRGRSMLASDMIDDIETVFRTSFQHSND